MKLLRAFFAPLILLAGLLVAVLPAPAVSPAVRATLLSSHGQVCIEAEVFVARATALDNKHINGYNDLICGMVSKGLWTKADAIYVLATQNTTSARLNLKSSSFSLTAMNSPTFTIDRGYAGNGTTSYLDTGFNPSTAGGVFTQNSASMGVWPTIAGNTDVVEIGVAATWTGGTYVNADSGTSLAFGSVNTSVVNSAQAAAGGQKFVLVNRSAAGAEQIYVNGLIGGTATAASQAPASANVFIGGSNNSGAVSYGSTKTIGFAWIGSSLGATDAMNLWQLVYQYYVRIGAMN